MEEKSFSERHPTLDSILNGFKVIPELTLYQLSDVLTIPVRNWFIPRILKKYIPELSCRGYVDRYNADPDKRYPVCVPSKKYTHQSLFLFKYVCRSYNDGKCRKRHIIKKKD